MKPLAVLLITFSILTILGYFLPNRNHRFNGRAAMSLMLFFTGISHFVFAQGMKVMLSGWIPFAEALIYITGALEIIGALGLLHPNHFKSAGLLLIIFLIAVLPANIYAAFHHINPVTGATDGPGLTYLWFRIPLQVLFILWIYFATKQTSSKN